MIDESQISSFYANKKILVTGGTGYMGRALIWKLLHSCPKLDVIFMLIRSKHGKSAVCRREDVFSSPIFDIFKKNNPEILDKVIFITGDVGEEGIGLSDDDRDMLIDQVSIIFHSAAMLKMDANLRSAVNVNTLGTVQMLDMAQKMKKLLAFVHISTAFCCCENLEVEEKIYSSKHNPYDIMNLVNWMDIELLDSITPKLIYPLPNTYIYSKRLTESLLPNYVSKVPIIVARPSVVIPSYKEPLPGWNDSLNGPVGFFIVGGRGIMRTTMLNIDVRSDIIPVDIAINGILTLPWANPKELLMQQISVYNVTQTAYKDLSWRQALKLFENGFKKYPPNTLLWYPNYYPFASNSLVYTIKCIFYHYLPAYVIDFLLLLVGRKPFLVRVHDKLRYGEKLLRYFSQQQWTFLHDNLLRIEKRFNAADRELFPINMNVATDIQSYVDGTILGHKIFIFNENLDTLDRAKRLATVMYIVDKIALVLRYMLLWKIVKFVFDLVLDLF